MPRSPRSCPLPWPAAHASVSCYTLVARPANRHFRFCQSNPTRRSPRARSRRRAVAAPGPRGRGRAGRGAGGRLSAWNICTRVRLYVSMQLECGPRHTGVCVSASQAAGYETAQSGLGPPLASCVRRRLLVLRSASRLASRPAASARPSALARSTVIAGRGSVPSCKQRRRRGAYSDGGRDPSEPSAERGTRSDRLGIESETSAAVFISSLAESSALCGPKYR